MSVRRAIFFDRDGVLNRAVVRDGKPYPPMSVDEVALEANAAEDVGRLKAAGFVAICVTNQPDVARGTLARETADEINDTIRRSLDLDDVIACFHDDSDDCACRKPRPGMLIEGARRWSVSLADSFMIGDRWRDVEAGAAAGCRTILVDRMWNEPRASATPELSVGSLHEAVAKILSKTLQ